MKQNPGNGRTNDRFAVVRAILSGAFWFNAGMLIVAPVIAFVVPLPAWPNGKVRGMSDFENGGTSVLDGTLEIWFTLILCMIFGGELFLAALCGLIGTVILRIARDRPEKSHQWAIAAALAVDTLLCLILATATDTLAPYLTFSS